MPLRTSPPRRRTNTTSLRNRTAVSPENGSIHFGPSAEITRTRPFNGFERVDPGLVRLTEWRSDEVERARPGGEWLPAG
jgi:hypothetical protein